MSSEYTARTKITSCDAPSTRRPVQFLVAVYIHALMLVILVIFSRNVFSTAIRTALSSLLR